MGHSWKKDRTKKRIATRYAEVRDVDIRDYKRETSLVDIPVNRAYRVQGAHVYIDIVNLADMLSCTDIEGETCHKRALRFLNQHYRAVHRILVESDAIRVDFHNQRLHAVVTSRTAMPTNAPGSSARLRSPSSPSMCWLKRATRTRTSPMPRFVSALTAGWRWPSTMVVAPAENLFS
ncbi:unnamed protein product [Stenotrophomonas maltophilia]|uniref:hypothetical protein n=1 Tax=Stenotrophomonas maltophilia TaxID=40324 RepID=UPI0006A9341D|nr:hypothetical protein [Stenotrophomonas maltophilia]CRX67203.1 unnamed protein product [Stenotrophomonas maltophilia]